MRRRSRLGLRPAVLCAAFTVVALTVPAAAGTAGTAFAGPGGSTTHRIEGLDQRVEIAIDDWGVPHLFAKTTDDAFLAQGFNAARDRLFQIDLWHRRGLGRLAEAFGPEYVEQDRATRLFLYRGDMDAEWDSYGTDSKRIATRFTTGVNAYIDWVKRNPEALPQEFRMLDYLPDRWQPEDVVRIRTHALVSGLSGEVDRARLACAGGLDIDPLRKWLQPAHRVEVPDGADTCLPDDLLDVYDLATQPVEFTGDAERPLARRPAADGAEEGSNNWTITGDRTTTGRPILANDPHRNHQAPSLRYISHLSAPGMNVIGGGEPALPGISIGHNESIAFGLTVFGIDAQDLYVYDLDDANARYRYKGGWEDLTTERERVAVRDGASRTVELQYTRHGPVIYVDEAKHKAYAVRSTWSQPGTSAYFASIGYMRADGWDGFLDAMARWGAPGENLVYADVDGNIGWKPGGLAPRRTGYDGLLPVPGDGRYEWDGFIPSEDLPEVFNPREGFFATANQYNLPPGTSPANVTAYEWSGPDRHQRIVSVLAKDRDHSLRESGRLQNDVVSPRAQALLRLIRPLHSTDPTEALALRFMSRWNGSEHLGSRQATLFEGYWEARLDTAVRDALVPAERRDLIETVDWLVIMDVLEHPRRWLGAGAVAERDKILRSTLRESYAAAARELGSDTAAWGYRGNSRTMPHPLGEREPSFDVGPYAIPGSSTTPIASGNASYRQVIDVGRWDRSLAINTPGQSGEPGDEHYRDLVEMWSKGRYFPLLYSRAAVDRHTEQRIVLVPA
ncbi:MAG: penicillin acylase family protein [Streptosporangiales bacterium]|nr:penicillin acylase family protein [Streptosporangiales bacterium]